MSSEEHSSLTIRKKGNRKREEDIEDLGEDKSKEKESGMMSKNMLMLLGGIVIVAIQLTILAVVTNQLNGVAFSIETKNAESQLKIESLETHLKEMKTAFETRDKESQAKIAAVDQHVQDIKIPSASNSMDFDVDTIKAKFHKVFNAEGSDKVTIHHYQHIYAKYISLLKGQDKVKLLEIGYGCANVPPAAVGGSVRAWPQIFNNQKLEMYLIEYDADCILNKHKDELAKIGVHAFAGDQSNRTFLKEFVAASGGNFDIIIDDGGHTMEQMRATIEELWAALKPGKYIALEDMQVVFAAERNSYLDGKPYITETIKGIIDYMMGNTYTETVFVNKDKGGHGEYVKEIETVDCMAEMCVFTKKK